MVWRLGVRNKHGKLSSMIRTLSLVMALTIGSSLASAQGTKDTPSGTQPTSATRSGTGTNSGSDTMGGAFKGTGTPSYGTSPGMGSQKRTQN
ncbi:hypothetical protein GA0061099_1007199 [Bradyrhizobium yuanmingense]|uniref:Uncharacterized protein n=1 Tax=Bradyrhizobium yuanmingense TaxID=108015 RepID=A0A1C3WTN4_9BRAD|nr:hypothetical protein IQ15_04957 [Bradyrhizobium yuanmingense]SCB43104.1 hypothetical protein GA0061099_1007199 [Bradyrhizobium yuanmingense]